MADTHFSRSKRQVFSTACYFRSSMKLSTCWPLPDRSATQLLTAFWIFNPGQLNFDVTKKPLGGHQTTGNALSNFISPQLSTPIHTMLIKRQSPAQQRPRALQQHQEGAGRLVLVGTAHTSSLNLLGQSKGLGRGGARAGNGPMGRSARCCRASELSGRSEQTIRRWIAADAPIGGYILSLGIYLISRRRLRMYLISRNGSDHVQAGPQGHIERRSNLPVRVNPKVPKRERLTRKLRQFRRRSNVAAVIIFMRPWQHRFGSSLAGMTTNNPKIDALVVRRNALMTELRANRRDRFQLQSEIDQLTTMIMRLTGVPPMLGDIAPLLDMPSLLAGGPMGGAVEGF